MQKVIVLTGAGMSADSGIPTFRDEGGLWEGHDIYQVASPEGWRRNPEMVLEFYNERRKHVFEADPNEGHKALVQLEERYDVTVITQNVDNLHERAGSTDVLHLHGELCKVRSEANPSLVYDIGGDPVSLGDTAEDGAQLRPHVVWFGELVPQMEEAARLVPEADILIVIGTSLIVYPAAGLATLAGDGARKYIIDPTRPEIDLSEWTWFEQRASEGTPRLVSRLLDDSNSNATNG